MVEFKCQFGKSDKAEEFSPAEIAYMKSLNKKVNRDFKDEKTIKQPSKDSLKTKPSPEKMNTQKELKRKKTIVKPEAKQPPAKMVEKPSKPLPKKKVTIPKASLIVMNEPIVETQQNNFLTE